MYKITKQQQINNLLCCWLNLKKLFKSISGLSVLMLFLLSASNLEAQCTIDNPGDVIICEAVTPLGYQLPAFSGTGLVDPRYWTGPGGTGTEYMEGDLIDFTTTMHIRDASGVGGGCEESFSIVWIPEGAGICIDGNPDDWPSVLNNVGGYNYEAVFIQDNTSADGISNNDTQFTEGSADVNIVNDPNAAIPNGWIWNLGNANNKGDISNGGAVLIGDKIFFFGDRIAINGDAQIGFWFTLDGISPLPLEGKSAGFTGIHKEGDLLALSNFTNGGGEVNLRLFRWVDDPNDAVYDGILPDPVRAPDGDESTGNLKFLGVDTNAVVNSVEVSIPTFVGPYAGSQEVIPQGGLGVWDYVGSTGPGITQVPGLYHEGAYFEGFIDLSGPEFQGVDTCFSSFILETRNSQSASASQQDFIAGPFGGVPEPEDATDSFCEEDFSDTALSTYNGDVIGNGDYVEWYSDEDHTAGITMTGVLTAAGSPHTFYALVYNQRDCPAPATLTINIDADPVVSSATDTFCYEDQTDKSLSDYDSQVGPGAGYTVSWFSDPARQNSATSTGGALAVGDTTFYATVTNDTTGCDSDTTLVITINADPVVSSATDTFCYEDQTDKSLSDYDSQVGPGAGYTVSWFSDPARQNSATSTGGALAVGDTTFYATVTNDTTGCDSDTTLVITINPDPDCTASNSSEGSEFGLCEGTTLNLYVTPADTNLYTYSWTSNGSANITNADMPNPTADNVADGEVFTVVITNKVTGCDSYCTTTARYYDCTPNCGTAFAVRTADVGGFDSVVEDDSQDTYSSCFRNDGFKRWGWTNTITNYGTYTYSVYRGAGRCDLSKGTYVGDLIVEYKDDGTVHFSYDLLTWDDDKDANTPEVPLYLISEVHLFVGCDPYPTKPNSEEWTVAPGQYPYNANIPDGTYHSGWQATKTGVTGSFYFIAHAVICDRDIPYPDDMHIPGEKRDYDEINLEGNSSFMDTQCTVDTGGWGKLEDKKVSFTAYPVPFQNEVNIGYKFEYDTDVKIDVYDIKGALIREAENTNYVKGTYDSTKIDLSYTDDQMYFVRLTTKEGTLVKKIISSTEQQ
ncbi:T9SS type A sorting domain-containing protein [Aestuariivivens sp. NBU2969]|uniref:T9SS type A sorting domain-containing protein n=1 Tax=Aestuariivivens sp. NBU2969 TaxID=2873267 RepID=UPI001CC0E16E|nr:T9SS type A sorting domain-containing protein [Aestuariivivens sp. NBU2969]